MKQSRIFTVSKPGLPRFARNDDLWWINETKTANEGPFLSSAHKNQSHRLHCQDPWFSLIKKGIKPVEGRKNSPRYAKWKAGDKVVFFLGDDEFETIITGINRYSSIEEYLLGETLQRALPGVATFDEGLQIYLQWNTREDVAKLGFIGIQITRISSQ